MNEWVIKILFSKFETCLKYGVCEFLSKVEEVIHSIFQALYSSQSSFNFAHADEAAKLF